MAMAMAVSLPTTTIVPSRSFGNVLRPHARPSLLLVRAQSAPINPSIKKDDAKVVDTVLVSDLEKPVQGYCRCWRSATFPFCDGAHVKHNKETGDNVGPLLVKK